MDNSWQQLELAILIAGHNHKDSQNTEILSNSINLINQIRSDPKGWKLALDVFINSSETIVKYTSLDILISWIRNGSYQFDDISIHQSLNTSLQGIISDPNNFIYKSSQSVLRKKFSVLLCMILQYDFPSLWKNPFSDLYVLCSQSESHCYLYVYVLTYINEEIGCLNDRNIYRNFKDLLRQGPLDTIWNHLFTLLSGYYTTNVSLTCAIIHCLETYFSWVPNHYIFNSQHLQLLYSLLSSSQFQIPILKAIIQIIDKGMNVEEKLTMLNSLDLYSMYSTLTVTNKDLFQNLENEMNTDSIDILYNIGDFINIIGYELYQLYRTVYNSEYQSLYLSLLDLFFKMSASFISMINICPSEFIYPVLEIMTDYCEFYDHPEVSLLSIYPQIQQYIPTLFNSLFHEIQFPKDFDPTLDISINNDTYDYQTKVYKLYQTIIKSVTSLCLESLQKRFDALELFLSQTHSTSYTSSDIETYFDWRSTEALYHTVYYLGDSMFKDRMTPFLARILKLYSTTSGHICHNNICVLSILQEILYRYTNVLLERPDLYNLEIFIYIQGLQHNEDIDMQKRAAYLLNKFIHRIQISKEIHDNLIQFVQPLLVVPIYPSLPQYESYEYIYTLYEVLSYLMVLSQNFTFHKEYISQLLDCIASAITDNKQNSNYLIYVMNCLLSILSGLQIPTDSLSTAPSSTQIQQYLHDELLRINSIITSLSSIYIFNIDIYNVIVSLLKVYIQTMQKDIIPLLPSLCVYLFSLPTTPTSSLYLPPSSPMPIITNNSNGCINISMVLLPPLLCLQLLSQIVGKYRDETYAVIESLLPSLTSYITDNFKHLNEDLDNEVLQQFYSFLSSILNIYPYILLSESLLPSLQNYYDFIFKGLSNVYNIAICKECLLMYRRLVKGFCAIQTIDSSVILSLAVHLQTMVFPYLASSIFYDTYNQKPLMLSLILEISALLLSINTNLPSYRDDIFNNYLSSMNADEQEMISFNSILKIGQNRVLQTLIKRLYAKKTTK